MTDVNNPNTDIDASNDVDQSEETTTTPPTQVSAASPSAGTTTTSSSSGEPQGTDTPLDESFEAVFLRAKHRQFVLALDEDSKRETFEFHVTEHLRMSGVYWATTSMALMGFAHEVGVGGGAKCDKLVAWLLSCYDDESGGFSGNVGHDPHLLYTLSAVQICALLDRMDVLEVDKVAAYVAGLQQDDGAFVGDEWGEKDTRFSYCALNCLALLGKLDAIDVEAATDWVARCKNFDGGFGTVPGAESHAGQIFCAVGALAIGKAMHHVDENVLGWWLAERQLPCGGLNGRPEKKEDVCYSWWVLSALAIMGRLTWIDRVKLGDFILSAQDDVDGGIADRPRDIADVFHTFFGVAGLSLLGYPGFQHVDPVFALPVQVIERLGIEKLYKNA